MKFLTRRRITHLAGLRIGFYNLRVGRRQSQVDREIRALLGLGLAVLGGCEGIRYKLPEIDGYRLVRDTSTKSRENIWAYVREDLYQGHRWIDLRGTWPRTEGPGTHEPRSFLRLRVGGMLVIVAHQAPKNAEGCWQLQHEGIEALVDNLAPWTRTKVRDVSYAKDRPRVVIWDSNRRPSETGPGPALLARRIGGDTVGERIDNAVVRGEITVSDVSYPDHVGEGRDRVELLTDHHHAFLFTITVPVEWTKPKEHR